MKYIVPKEFLDKYKEFADRFSSHLEWCGANINNHFYNGVDYCNCGFSKRVKQLKELEKEITEYNEKTPL